MTPVPVSFDCAIRGTKVWIAFTGVTGTIGRNNIAVGSGTSAGPIAFTFQTFDSGNGGNDSDSCPAIALGAGVAYCCYISAPNAGPISFLMRGDYGLGFGAPLAIGTLALPDVREFGRLQATVLATLPEITFGTPTTGSLVVAPPG